MMQHRFSGPGGHSWLQGSLAVDQQLHSATVAVATAHLTNHKRRSRLKCWHGHKLAWTCCREHPVDWEAPAHPLAKREPRRGRRAALAATLHTPAGPLLVYNLHLEVRQLRPVKAGPL